MKLSVSLPDRDVEFLDALAHERHESRSATVQHAISLLRQTRLMADYERAWDDWQASGDAEAWEPIVADGLTD